MVLAEFRQRYPQGSLVSELVDIDRGTYIVRVSIKVENIVLATGLAAADRVETAEDAARERAIAALVLDLDRSSHSATSQGSSPKGEIPKLSHIVNDSQAIAPVISQQPVSQADDRVDNGAVEKGDREKVAQNVAQNADYPLAQPEPEPETETEDTSLETQLIQEPIVEEKTASEPVIVIAEKPVETSGNLFAGTKASETTVEQLLADGANISTGSSAADSSQTAVADPATKIDFTEMKHRTDLEIKRLGWTKDDGQEFLRSRYGKRSRLQLTDEQLWEFLQYLETQPNPS